MNTQLSESFNWENTWDVINANMRSHPQRLIKHQLQSFDEFIGKDIENIISSNPITVYGEYNKEKAKYDKLPIASTASGYPIVYEDEKFFNMTGIRKQKMNVTKSVGYFLYNETKGLKEPIKSFQSTLKRFPSKVYTQEDIDEVVNAYVDSQIEKKKLI